MIQSWPRGFFLGLILYQRQVEDLEVTNEEREADVMSGTEWCVLLLEPDGGEAEEVYPMVYSREGVQKASVFRRVGLVWVEGKDLEMATREWRGVKVC